MAAINRKGSKARWAEQYSLFLKRLVLAREQAGMTQRQAADKISRSQSYVAKSESGERRVDVVELAEFARTYGVPVSFFLETDYKR